MNDPAPFEQPSFMVTLYFEIFYHKINTTMKFPFRIGVLMKLNIMLVGNRTKERSRKIHGYTYP